MNPELHRPITPERITPHGTDLVIEATAAECQALADRMLLPGIRAVTCRFHLVAADDASVMAFGHLTAVVVQTCVVSLDEFEATVEERFKIRFVPSGQETDDDDPESIDEIPYEGRLIDIGEAVAEQLGLALDPYPRKPGAELPSELGTEDSGPFAALAKLKKKT